MTAQEFEARVVAWARHQSDVVALILAGSRAGVSEAEVDGWSDWDFHLISRHPGRFFHPAWTSEIAPCWCAHARTTPRGVVKISAVFENGWEADFIPLANWQMQLVYWGNRHPGLARWMTARLRNGIRETRRFMLGSGYRVLIGGAAWERRLEALQVDWPEPGLTLAEFSANAGAFWQKAVWVFKKIARPEPRSAAHALQLLAVDHVYLLLEDEARAAGRQPRPEARKAEQWLDATRLAQTAALTPSLDPATLARALLDTIDLFVAAERSVAATRGFTPADHAAIEAWLRTGLAQLLRPQPAGGSGQG